jgi:hypothetical protein
MTLLVAVLITTFFVLVGLIKWIRRTGYGGEC